MRFKISLSHCKNPFCVLQQAFCYVCNILRDKEKSLVSYLKLMTEPHHTTDDYYNDEDDGGDKPVRVPIVL